MVLSYLYASGQLPRVTPDMGELGRHERPLMVVAKNLGHADTRMVERHYGHLAPSYVADAIRAGAPRFSTKSKRIIAITTISTSVSPGAVMNAGR